MQLTDVIKAAMDEMKLVARTETVIGEPIAAGGVTLIPVSRVSIGFAAGGAAESKPSGAGTGGGVSIQPVAFVAVVDGKVQIHSLTKSDLDLSKLFAMAPDLVGKLSRWLDPKGERKEKD